MRDESTTIVKSISATIAASPIVKMISPIMHYSMLLCSAGPMAEGGWIRRGIFNRVPRERRGGLKIFAEGVAIHG
jgi:hypothetical protein